MRIKILRIIISATFCVVIGGLAYLQVVRGQYHYRLSRNNRVRVVPIEGRRGRIFDRNGLALAENRVSFDVAIVPQEMTSSGQLFEFLAEVLDEDAAHLQKVFRKNRLAPFVPVEVAFDIPLEQALHLEESKFLYPGLLVRVGSRREYPFGQLGAHVIGYVGRINRSKLSRLKEYGFTAQNIIGYSGVEEYYDAYLNGENGGNQVEVNARGEQVQLLGSKKPLSGQDITLTIDARIQTLAHDVLGEKQGAIVLLDYGTGEILAMVSSPSFDPNDFAGKKAPAIQHYFSDVRAPLLNRAISGQFPPGSVFKVVMALGGLDSGKIQPSTTFNCPSYYQLGRRRFRCTHAHGIQNLTEAIAHSCNVYFYNVGLELGPDTIAHYASLFGLGSVTHVDLPYEVSGNIPDRLKRKLTHRKNWYEGDTLNISIGQGEILATPIQIASLMAMIARNGSDVRPHIIKQVGLDRQGYVSDQNAVDIPRRHFEIVQAGMRAAVGDYSGTAHLIDMQGLAVYGKTGTAQAGREKLSHAWFAGFVPSSAQKIAFCVFLENGGSSYNAVRITRELLSRLKQKNIL